MSQPAGSFRISAPATYQQTQVCWYVISVV